MVVAAGLDYCLIYKQRSLSSSKKSGRINIKYQQGQILVILNHTFYFIKKSYSHRIIIPCVKKSNKDFIKD